MKHNLYPVSFEDFLKIMNVGNYTIMYAVFDDFIYLEMPIENQIFASKKYFNSLREEIQLNTDDDIMSQVRFFFRHYLKTKNYYQFYPCEVEKQRILDLKIYRKLLVKEANLDFEYNPDEISMKEDDINVYLYQLDKLIYKMEKN